MPFKQHVAFWGILGLAGLMPWTAGAQTLPAAPTPTTPTAAPPPPPPRPLRLVVEPADRAVLAEITNTKDWAWPLDTVAVVNGGRSKGAELLTQLRERAYLAASLDSLQGDSLVRLFLGPKMYWVEVRTSSVAEQRWLEAGGFSERLFRNKPLYYETLLRLQQRILEQAEDNGYPFAAVWLDSLKVTEEGRTSARLRIAPGAFFTFKSLKINGEVRLPKSFLPQYLGIKPGAPYSRGRVLRSRELLTALPYLEQSANPTVTFAGQEATVNLWLKKKRAGRFDFLIGLLPQPVNAGTTNADTRLVVTGSLNAAFHNSLNLGERLTLDFERLRPETQRLDVQTTVPYLLGSPFGVEGRLGIYRRDSTWVDAQSSVGVQYLFGGLNSLQFFWENKSSSLQKVDTQSILNTRRLPANLDLRSNGFGFEANVVQLDYRFNPRQGWALQARTSAGFQTVQRNSQIEQLVDPQEADFQFSSLYDTLTLRSTRLRAEGRAEYFLPFLKRSTVLLRARGGGIFSKQPVYANEQYRLGGNKLLRGFDEESLFATRWVVTTLEVRLLTGRNSYLAAFTDYAYLENITTRNRIFLRPWGIGAGMNFETQAGIFGISAAVGRRNPGEDFDLRAAKFHIGYVSVF